MIFTPTEIAGVYVVELEPHPDERGFFARSWCAREFEQHGLDARLVQSNVSYNLRHATLRGLHYQAMPHPETKLIRCTQGAIYDVALDLRPEQPTYRKWFGLELSAQNRRALYIPAGCAHGFQSLTDGSEVLYHMSEFYHPALAKGVRWNDPSFAITWPLPNPLLSPRDAGYPDFSP